MKQSEFEEKINELEEAMVERRAELGRTKTSEAEDQKLLSIQQKTEALLDDAKRARNEEKKQDVIHRANEILIELRQHPLA